MRNAMMSIVTAVVLTSTSAWAQIVPVPSEKIADYCQGDLNGDGIVNLTDLASVLSSYGICRGCDEDLNLDGYVDETDVRILTLQWGPCVSDEDVITESSRTVADVSDGPEIYAGGDATDDMFSDEEQVRGESLVRQYRRSSAAAEDGPEIYAGGDTTDDMFSDQEQERGRTLVRQYRRSSAAAEDGPEIFEGDVATNGGAFSDTEQTTCEGDLDRNGQVDSTDMAMLLTKYGRCRGCEEDLNGDGVVDEEDVDILLDVWGKCPEEKSKHLSRSLAATDGAEIEQDLPSQNEPEEVEPQCPGDLDGNGTIDSTDLAILLSRYGRCIDCEADLTGDGQVDQDDIDELMALWGDCPAETFSDTAPKRKSHPESLTGG